MKKCISLVLSSLLIFSLAYTHIVYAEEESFFTVSSNEVSKTETLEMTIDLSLIEYDNFVFTLESDYSLEGVEVSYDESEEEEAEDETENETEAEESEEEEENENKFEMQIAKSDNIDIEEIILAYTLPEEAQVGDVITFVATITNIENEEETESIQVEITVVEETSEDEENEEEALQEEDSLQDSNKTQNSESSQDSNEEQTAESMQTEGAESLQMNQTNTSETVEDTAQVEQTSIDSTTDQETETEGLENEVTYNGSDNNYLSELSIEDVDLTQVFQKDKTTYFASVDSDIEEVEITAEAEDEDATVCIYGDEDLEEGINKILISVTAENGNVRTYRIYITVE